MTLQFRHVPKVDFPNLKGAAESDAERRKHPAEPGTGETLCSFSDPEAQAAAREETAIGVVTSIAGTRQIRLNPGSDSRWACEEIEQVIVLEALARRDEQRWLLSDGASQRLIWN